MIYNGHFNEYLSSPRRRWHWSQSVLSPLSGIRLYQTRSSDSSVSPSSHIENRVVSYVLPNFILVFSLLSNQIIAGDAPYQFHYSFFDTTYRKVISHMYAWRFKNVSNSTSWELTSSEIDVFLCVTSILVHSSVRQWIKAHMRMYYSARISF